MAASFDAAGTTLQNANTGAARVDSGNFTIANQSNRLLIVDVVLFGQAQSVSAIAWDPTGVNEALTLDASQNCGTANTFRMERWIKKNPTAKTAVVGVTLSANNSAWDFGYRSYYGVDQTTSLADPQATNGAGGNPTISHTHTTVNGDMGHGFAGSTAGNNTSNSGTNDWRDNSGNTNTSGNHEAASGTSLVVSNTWDAAADDMAFLSVVIKQTAGGGPTPIQQQMTESLIYG